MAQLCKNRNTELMPALSIKAILTLKSQLSDFRLYIIDFNSYSCYTISMVNVEVDAKCGTKTRISELLAK